MPWPKDGDSKGDSQSMQGDPLRDKIDPARDPGDEKDPDEE